MPTLHDMSSIQNHTMKHDYLTVSGPSPYAGEEEPEA